MAWNGHYELCVSSDHIVRDITYSSGIVPIRFGVFSMQYGAYIMFSMMTALPDVVGILSLFAPTKLVTLWSW